MFLGKKLYPSIPRRLVAAGSLILAAALVAASPALSQGPECPDNFAAARRDPQYRELQQAVDAYLRERGADEYISGVSLHVSRAADAPAIDVAAGRTSFEKGAGPICPGTLFQIGSITKSFTAVLLLQLEARGILDIHETVGDWLPQYPEWASVTIEQLLNMTAPIADYAEVPALQREEAADIRRYWRPRALVDFVYPGTDLPTPPPWFYSNTNYILAEMIIERAAGMRYAEALRTMLFEPLGLSETYYYPRTPAPDRVLRAMASGYFFGFACPGYDPQCNTPPFAPLRREDLKGNNLSWAAGAGGIISSLRDVTRWVRALFGDVLLPPRQQAKLFSLVSTTTGRPIADVTEADRSGFSLGVGKVWLSAALTVWWYEGGTLGFRVAWFRRPGDDLVVAIALNSWVDPANDRLITLYPTVLNILESTVAVGAVAPPPEMDFP